MEPPCIPPLVTELGIYTGLHVISKGIGGNMKKEARFSNGTYNGVKRDLPEWQDVSPAIGRTPLFHHQSLLIPSSAILLYRLLRDMFNSRAASVLF